MESKVRYLPATLNIRDRPVVVIGGGRIADRKVAELLGAGARLTVISPTIGPRLARWVREGRIRHRSRPYRRGDLRGSRLAVAATSDATEQLRIARDARNANTWLNVVDRTELCDFLAPAVLRRGDLTIAVSTGGHNPALARWVKHYLSRVIGSEFRRVNSILTAVRAALRASGVDMPSRRRIVDRLMDGHLAERVRANDRDGIVRLIRRVAGLPSFTLSRPPRRGVSERARATAGR